MNSFRRAIQMVVVLSLVLIVGSLGLAQGQTKKPYEPTPGQPGKDSVWVPTPFATLEKMFDMAKLTPNDFVMDLGSGDGRAIITAAKRGTPGLGVEWNEQLVELSRQLAEKAGVSHLAKFVKGDMFAADLSKASVLGLFMLPEQFAKLTPKFLAMKPGSRISVNGFTIPNWPVDATDKATGDCGTWCTVHLYIVPANVAGNWQLAQGELQLTQNFQMLNGTLTAGGKATPIADGRMNGEEISFSVGSEKYTGRVAGTTMKGTISGGGAWTASKK